MFNLLSIFRKDEGEFFEFFENFVNVDIATYIGNSNVDPYPFTTRRDMVFL